MRQPQNAKRGRGRGRRGNGGGQPHVPNRNTSYESNGPEVKLRGNAQQLNEKYMSLAQDAAQAGERISAEAYSQFADHYFRLHQAAVGAAETKRQQEQAAEQAAGASSEGAGDQPQAQGDAPAESAGDAPRTKRAPRNNNGRGRNPRAANNDANNEQSADAATNNGADNGADVAAPAEVAEVATLSPAQLAEAVQDEQDNAAS